MKPRIVTLPALLLWFGFSFSQTNLVPNNSFETYTSCPNTNWFPNDIHKAPPWFNPTGCSPDYFHSCNTPTDPTDVPTNWRGFQFARTGQGYLGIDVYEYVALGREYIQVKLNDTLIAGKKYYVEYYVSRADNSKWAVNNLGVYFSSSSFYFPGCDPLPFTPQLVNTIVPLNDTAVWTKIADTLTATGSELYMTIGNFFDNAQTDTVYIGTGMFNDAYYYIDDILVIDVDSLASIPEQTPLTFTLSPNPSNGIFTIRHAELVSASQIEVYNTLGELIFSQELQTTNTELDLRGKLPGIYFITLRTPNGISTQKLVISPKG